MNALLNAGRNAGRILILTVLLSILTMDVCAAVNLSGQVTVTQTGFGRNRSTGLWVATITVKNPTGLTLPGPIQVVFTNLPASVVMQNSSGTSTGPSVGPYITVTTGTLGPGQSVQAVIQFTNPSNGYINYTPVVYGGGL